MSKLESKKPATGVNTQVVSPAQKSKLESLLEQRLDQSMNQFDRQQRVRAAKSLAAMKNIFVTR